MTTDHLDMKPVAVENYAALLTHPAVESLPPVYEIPYRDMMASVRAGGINKPIVLLDGYILDGRRRLRACIDAGTAPRFVEFGGNDTPMGYALRANLPYRKINAGAKALIAAEHYDTPVDHGYVYTRHRKTWVKQITGVSDRLASEACHVSAHCAPWEKDRVLYGEESLGSIYKRLDVRSRARNAKISSRKSVGSPLSDSEPLGATQTP